MIDSTNKKQTFLGWVTSFSLIPFLLRGAVAFSFMYMLNPVLSTAMLINFIGIELVLQSFKYLINTIRNAGSSSKKKPIDKNTNEDEHTSEDPVASVRPNAKPISGEPWSGYNDWINDPNIRPYEPRRVDDYSKSFSNSSYNHSSTSGDDNFDFRQAYKDENPELSWEQIDRLIAGEDYASVLRSSSGIPASGQTSRLTGEQTRSAMPASKEYKPLPINNAFYVDLKSEADRFKDFNACRNGNPQVALLKAVQLVDVDGVRQALVLPDRNGKSLVTAKNGNVVEFCFDVIVNHIDNLLMSGNYNSSELRNSIEIAVIMLNDPKLPFEKVHSILNLKSAWDSGPYSSSIKGCFNEFIRRLFPWIDSYSSEYSKDQIYSFGESDYSPNSAVEMLHRAEFLRSIRARLINPDGAENVSEGKEEAEKHYEKITEYNNGQYLKQYQALGNSPSARFERIRNTIQVHLVRLIREEATRDLENSETRLSDTVSPLSQEGRQWHQGIIDRSQSTLRLLNQTSRGRTLEQLLAANQLYEKVDGEYLHRGLLEDARNNFSYVYYSNTLYTSWRVFCPYAVTQNNLSVFHGSDEAYLEKVGVSFLVANDRSIEGNEDGVKLFFGGIAYLYREKCDENSAVPDISPCGTGHISRAPRFVAGAVSRFPLPEGDDNLYAQKFFELIMADLRSEADPGSRILELIELFSKLEFPGDPVARVAVRTAFCDLDSRSAFAEYRAARNQIFGGSRSRGRYGYNDDMSASEIKNKFIEDPRFKDAKGIDLYGFDSIDLAMLTVGRQLRNLLQFEYDSKYKPKDVVKNDFTMPKSPAAGARPFIRNYLKSCVSAIAGFAFEAARVVGDQLEGFNEAITDVVSSWANSLHNPAPEAVDKNVITGIDGEKGASIFEVGSTDAERQENFFKVLPSFFEYCSKQCQKVKDNSDNSIPKNLPEVVETIESNLPAEYTSSVHYKAKV